MIHGSCHCGAVKWQLRGMPEAVTACNCTLCRRYGALWAYDFEEEGIGVTGLTKIYMSGADIEFHFCAACGCAAYWRAKQPGADERRRIAVNMRLTEPHAVAKLPVRHFDGLDTFEELPRDARCVADHWF